MVMTDTRRFNVIVEKETYKRLKGCLALDGVTISQWVRLCIKVYLDNYEENKSDSTAK